MEFNTKKLTSSSVSNATDAAITIGKSALHALAPDNYEYYMCSLELIDKSFKQVGFISFVVMPNNISESIQPIQSQVKTKDGMVTMFNDSFAPVNISLHGTFGRKLRLVTGVVNPNSNKEKGWQNFFNGNMGRAFFGMKSSWLSGYGLTRILKYILDESTKLDSDGRPYVLLFNNYAFNTSYVVDVVNYSFNQSTENNMLWYYEVSLKGIAPASAVRPKTKRIGQLLATVASNALAKSLTNIVKDVKRNNDCYFV